MLATKNMIRVGQLAGRRLISCEVKRNTVDPKIRAKQELFQVDNGLPVFLKGGVMDRILYKATIGLSLLGLAGFCKLIYDLDQGKIGEAAK